MNFAVGCFLNVHRHFLNLTLTPHTLLFETVKLHTCGCGEFKLNMISHVIAESQLLLRSQSQTPRDMSSVLE